MVSTWPDRLRYVVVEGPIGAGKTSLARMLAQRSGGDLLLEGADSNPFLRRFYEDPERHALAAQMFFLFQRVDQVRALRQGDLFRGVTVADFFLDKDPLFARLTLDEEELILYRRLFAHLAPQAPRPDLVIYLQASPRVLVERVRLRGVAYERNVTEQYLARLSEAYLRFFHDYTVAPVLVVNSERVNFVEREQDFALLLRRITEMRGAREYLNFAA
ncbi:MAG: deoxynucleoside kinase [Betaproteobacteria bacterium]|jgi:deoxyadenosine/deoxycytidine kinase